MWFGFKQPLVGEKRCVTTLITAAEETRRFHTPYDVNCTNLHILTARGMSHYFDSN